MLVAALLLIAPRVPQGAPSSSAALSSAALLARCADCHPSEVAAYARTGMARALEPLHPGELAGLAPVAESATGFVYAFEDGGASARIVESFARAPKDGAATPAWRDSAPLAFAIGAGELDRSFVLQRAGRLWLAPLEAVGHAGARRAALAPGHAMTPGTRFTLPVTPECLGCHTDSPPPQAWPLNLAPRDWTPRGISCAACHGALAEHVRARERQPEHGESEPDPLAREKEWSRVARMERCAACHLQGDARIELDPRRLDPRRLDPSRLGPPPSGTPLLATRAVFVARVPGDEIGFVSQVQRLVLSRCYLESAQFPGGGLACESCHDPHRSPAEPAERALLREACRACHEPLASVARRASDCALARAERATGRDCVDCHMRATGVFDVAGVAIHDHWIRRAPPAASPPAPLRFPESASGDWRLFTWPGESAGESNGEPEPDPGLWTMALAHGGLAARAREFLARGPGTRARELAMLHHVRGSLLEESGDTSAARRAYEHALELDPELCESTTNLGPLLARVGEAAAGKSLLDDLILRHPLADGAWRNRALVRLALGDQDGCRADLENAMKLLPDASLAGALAKIAEQRGDAAGARRWRDEARRLDPRLP